MANPSKHRFRPGREESRADFPFPLADPETIERARDGDRDALAEVWRIHHPQVLRLLQAKRTEAPDDVATRVWVEVGRSIAGFDGDGRRLQKWIFTVASRESSPVEVRRLGRRSNREGRWRRPARVAPTRTPLRRTGDIDGGPSPLGEALGFIGNLAPEMAEVVMLRVVHDMSVADVASITGSTDGNVRLLTHRGLAQLRRELAAYDADATSP